MFEVKVCTPKPAEKTCNLIYVYLCSSTQFRWRPFGLAYETWGLDDVYIGDACPAHCSGRGECINGQCHCDPGFTG